MYIYIYRYTHNKHIKNIQTTYKTKQKHLNKYQNINTILKV